MFFRDDSMDDFKVEIDVILLDNCRREKSVHKGQNMEFYVWKKKRLKQALQQLLLRHQLRKIHILHCRTVPLRGCGMAMVKPVATVPLARFPQILPLSPPRRWRADSTRSITSSADAGGELPARLQPNARRSLWHGGGFSLGVDLGAARTGLAVGRGITQPRPLTVLRLRGQKLELMLLDVAQKQEADELIIGLPVSADGRETPQSNKVRSVVGRLAVQAADRGLRVYLQDEHGTSIDALNYMISRGVKRTARDVKSDAYAAVMILERYFSSSGQGAQIVLPRQQELQDKLILKSMQDADI